VRGEERGLVAKATETVGERDERKRSFDDAFTSRYAPVGYAGLSSDRTSALIVGGAQSRRK